MARDWTREIGVTWDLLVEAAGQGGLLYYSDIAEAIGTNPRIVGAVVLHPIQRHCIANELPPLTGLVVRQDTERAGKGFLGKDEAPDKQRQQIYGFPWETAPRPLAKDSKGAFNALESAHFTNFTCIPNGRWVFSPALNVIVGENGLGKSHVLKAIYSVLKAQEAMGGDLSGPKPSAEIKSRLEKAIATELVENFRPDPDDLGRLVKRGEGHEQTEVKLSYNSKLSNIAFSCSTHSSAVALHATPDGPILTSPVFVPTRELLTLCPEFPSLYDNAYLRFEKSWRDSVSLLSAPNVRGHKEAWAKDLLEPIEKAMGGKIEADSSGRFYLDTGVDKIEASMVAEGLRKFAVLARLVSTGVLLGQGYLFWDEPETNLNSKLIKTLAQVIVDLAQHGVQTFIATHSLFLLREISILAEKCDGDKRPRYFGLVASGDEEVARLEQGDALADLQTLVMLEEDLLQSDRYLGV